jgi:hypothetical protein
MGILLEPGGGKQLTSLVNIITWFGDGKGGGAGRAAIVEDLPAALEQFRPIAEDVGRCQVRAKAFANPLTSGILPYDRDQLSIAERNPNRQEPDRLRQPAGEGSQDLGRFAQESEIICPQTIKEIAP